MSGLLALPWEDVLVPHVLRLLPLRQLLSLRRVSRAFRELVRLYLANMRRFDSAQVPRGGRGAGGGGSGLGAPRLGGRARRGEERR